MHAYRRGSDVTAGAVCDLAGQTLWKAMFPAMREEMQLDGNWNLNLGFRGNAGGNYSCVLKGSLVLSHLGNQQ